MPAENPPSPAGPATGRGCLPALVRLTWIFGGIILIFSAVFIAQGKGGLIADLSPFAMALVLVLVRFADIRYLNGETMDNKPATLGDWRRYAVKVLIVAGALYALGKFLAPMNIF